MKYTIHATIPNEDSMQDIQLDCNAYNIVGHELYYSDGDNANAIPSGCIPMQYVSYVAITAEDKVNEPAKEEIKKRYKINWWAAIQVISLLVFGFCVLHDYKIVSKINPTVPYTEDILILAFVSFVTALRYISDVIKKV